MFALLSPLARPAQAQPNGIYLEVYSGITGTAITNLTSAPAFLTNAPSSTNILTGSFETSQNAADNYGQRLRGLITPFESGSHVFWIASDDNSVLYLSSDESAFNKTAIARVNSSTTYRQWTKEANQQSTNIYLEAGRRYYIEALHKEGTGNDNLSVRWRRPSGLIEEPIPGLRMRPFGRPAVSPPAFTAHPSNLSLTENAAAIFRVGISNLDVVWFQWQRNGTNIPGANGATFTIPSVRTNDTDSVFQCVATNALGTNLSLSATLIVTPDTTSPSLYAAGNLNSNTVEVVFSEPVAVGTATNLANYAIDNGVTISRATQGTNSRVIFLATSAMLRGSNYTLTVNNVSDLAAATNVIAANSQFTFSAMLKGVFREVFLNMPGAAVADLYTYPAFPNSPDSANLMANLLEAPSDVADLYGQRLRATLLPPVSGNYVFTITADEAASLWIGTNETPAGATLIASCTAAAMPRQWDFQSSQTSLPISLVAGRRYYLEVLMKESLSTDHLAVRMRMPDGFVEEPLPVSWLAPYGMNAPVIAAQPVDYFATEGLMANFSVSVSNVDVISYQWQQSGTNLPGATNATFTNALVRLDEDGSIFQCVLANVVGSTSTVAVILHVAPDVTAPALLGAINMGATNVVVYFSERIDGVSAATPTNFSVSGVTVLEAQMRADGRSVLLTVTPLTIGSFHTVTVNHVLDRANTANVIAANSQVTFEASLLFSQDVGTSALPLPSVFTVTNGGFDITAAGADVGGTNDQASFNFERRTGDFDVRVRLQRLDYVDLWTEAGLVAREDLSGGSRFAGAFATPSIGGTFFLYRTAPAGSSTMTGTFPANYPDTWLRLQRVANEFTGYASFDGQSWVRLGIVTNALPATIYLGLAVASHGSAQSTVAQFRDYGDTSGGVLVPPTFRNEVPGPSSRRTPLTFTEIMYHPAERTDGRSLEFIEIFNSNPWFHDLSGYRISGDVDFTFPPGTMLQGGAYLVVARVPADVQAVYGISNVVGPYTNNLPNNNGTVRLRNRTDGLLLEVNYDSKASWPASADGGGHSLVLARPSLHEGNALAWAQSDRVGGSPGAADGTGFDPVREVVINEFLANPLPGGLDFIELYNHSTNTVDISGCWLTDDVTTNKFQIPPGTLLAPTSAVYFTETTLGFGLNADGETLLLVNSNRTRVIDSVRFTGQERGFSSGRYPDGSPGFVGLAAPTPGSRNAARRQFDVVISEVMYHPISENDDDEFIELHNRGASALNLANWQFTDGIDFTFATNATLAPGGYLVLARNRARMLANYPALNPSSVVGDFQGSLRNSGERLALEMPTTYVTTNLQGVVRTNTVYVTVSDFVWGTGGRWGEWSDGGGSSLELIDLNADPRQASSWADSDETTKAPWTLVTTTATLDNSNWTNWNSLQIYLQDKGECLVDDVAVSIVGGSNLVSNPGFEAGTNAWAFQGNHVRSGVVAGGYSGANALRVRGSGRGDTGANRVRTSLTSTYSNNVTGTITAQVRWLRGSREILFRLRGNHMEAPGVFNLPTNLGTPGALNSRAVPNAGPAISDVAHSPVLPAANQPVVVTARVNDPNGVTSVQLVYRVDPAGATNSIAMSDDGTGGDLVPGDGLYAATIPGQTNGALVAFYVGATDGDALPVQARFPHDAPVRECLVRYGETMANTAFGSYRFWLTKANFDRWVAREKLSNEPIEGTFIYGNWRIIYNAGDQYAGSPYHSPSFNSPTGNFCDYYVTLPADDSLMNAQEFTLQQPGNGGGDAACQTEQTSYWIADQLNIPFLYRRSVNVYVNGVARGRIYEDTQQPNGDFNAQWFPDDPGVDLYKIMIWFEFDDAASGFASVGATLNPVTTTGGVKKLARYRQNFGKRVVQDSASNYTNIFNLVDALAVTNGGGVYSAAVLPLVDIDEWARAFSVERIVGNNDLYGNGGGQNCYIGKPAAGKWNFLIWDIDFAFNSQPPTGNLFNFTDTPITRMFAHPPVLRAYWQALEDAANGPLVPSKANALLDARYAAFQACGITATAPTNIKSYISQRRDYILALLMTNRPAFSMNIANGSTVTNFGTLFALSGTAPFSLRHLFVNGREYALNWGTITNWNTSVFLTSQTNSIVVEGYDGQGNLLTNASRSFTVYVPFVVARPEDSLRITEIMFNPAISNAGYVEIFNRSSNTTFDLTGYRLEGVDYDFPDGVAIGPSNYVMLVESTNGYLTAYGPPTNALALFDQFDGNLDRDGEMLKLVRREGTNETIITRVRYSVSAPWPDGPGQAESGVALQLIDPAQDAARVSNWGDPTSWKFFSFTGTNGSSRLYMYLDYAGDVYLDDIRLELGTVAGAGSNMVRNGDFEAPLTNTWYVWTNSGRPYAALSATSSNFFHGGSNSLHLVFTNAGSTLAYLYQDITNLAATNICTMSYWYRPSTNATNLTVRMGSNFRPTINVRPIPSTPAGPNSLAARLPAYPLLWLNEVQPGNTNTLADNTGAFEPWVELFNSGTNILPLTGCALTDDYQNPGKWPFPSNTFIAPGSFLVVFTDGHPERSTGTVLHTSFRLSPTNGSIGLTRTNLLLDYLNFSNVPPGFTYGALPDGQLFDRRQFFVPTPGASNNPTPVSIAINEWMASNTRTLLNPATLTYSDWFELYNYGNTEIDLSGYYLTDNAGFWNQWRIPNGTLIPPQQFLMVWADGDVSGTNRIGNALHVSFQLSRNGDSIGLFNPEGEPVHLVTFGFQNSDISQGLFTDGNIAGVHQFMTVPTPGTNNTLGGNSYAPVLAAIPDAEVIEGTLLSFACSATDGDVPAQALTYTLVAGAPFGATIHPVTGAFSWTPIELQGGTNFSITVRVSDNGVPTMSDEKTFTVTVLKTNSTPGLALVETQTIPELVPFSLAIQAADDDVPAQTLVFSLLSAPPGMTVDTNTGVIAWTPTENQGPSTNDVVVLVADDGMPSLIATQAFLVVVQEVNGAPTLGPWADQVITELSTITLTNVASDLDLPAQALSFDLVSGPTNALLDPQTGVFTWTPAEEQGPSTNLVVFRVSDNAAPALSATQVVTIVVEEVNLAPQFTNAPGPFIVAEWTALSFTNEAADADLPANQITFELLSAPAGLTLDTNSGAVAWVPTEADGGSSNAIIVRVFDNGTPSLSATQTVVVLVAEGNATPSLTVPADVEMEELITLTVTNLVSDADLPVQLLTFALVSAPAGVQLDSVSGELTWTPVESQAPSTNLITVSVTDGDATNTGSFTIVVREVNQPPVFTNPPGPIAALPGSTVVVTNVAIDPDLPANAIVYGLVSPPEGAVVDTNTGALTWTVPAGYPSGTNVLLVVASDDGMPSLSATQEVRVMVVGPSLTLDPIEDKTLDEMTVLSFQLHATSTGISNAVLSYYIVRPPSPSGAIVYRTSGLFGWMPAEAQGPATNLVTVYVQDNSIPPLVATQSFNVIVREVNRAPAFTGGLTVLTTAPSAEIYFTNTVSDLDLPSNLLTFELLSGPETAVLDTNSGVLQWTAPPAQVASTNRFLVRVSDDGVPSLSATQTVTVIVTNANTPPLLILPSDQMVDELTQLTVTNMATDVQSPPQILTFALVSAPAGMQIDTNTGVLTWTPTEDQGPTTNLITVSVTDGVETNSGSFTVLVNEVNVAPVLPDLPDRILHAGERLAFTNLATDADLPANLLTYSLSNAPLGAMVESGTGAFSWTPGEAASGTTNLIAFIAQDDGSPTLAVGTAFTVVVLPRPGVLSVMATNGIIHVAWSAIPGKTYRVQYTTELNPPDWHDLPGDVTATEGTAGKSDSTEAIPQRFYRVMLVP